VTRITKHNLVTDSRGRILARTVEHLADDGRQTSVVRRTAVSRCPGCWSPVSAAEQLTSVCQYCRTGPLCRACARACQVCNRVICGRCRRGFVWGRTPVTACPVCYGWLNRRAVHEQRVAAGEMARASALQLHRERLRSLILRLQAARLGFGQGARSVHGGRLGSIRR